MRAIIFTPSDNIDDSITVERDGDVVSIYEHIGETNDDFVIHLSISDVTKLINALKEVTE
jgi:hypothetical protein